MNLRPTNVPLTAKEFDTVRCGVCAGCGCACGYIAYLKEGKLIDLYGHPHDPNGIGSLCTKGITLLQEAPTNPLRLREPVLREGGEFRKVSLGEVKEWVEKNLRGRVGVFLDRLTDLRDYSLVRSLGWEVYSDSLYLPFRASTLRPQEWREQRVILSLECEPVFSEVMATRWLVDAFERSSYILSLSSRYATTSAKSTERLILKPPLTVRFLEELADMVWGVEREYTFGDRLKRLHELLSIVENSLILVGETLLRSKWAGNVLDSLRRIRRRIKVNYSIVGNVTPLPSKGIQEFKRDLKEIDAWVLFGNPAVYLSEEEIKEVQKKKVLSVTPFPNLTANVSTLVLPPPLFSEREFLGFRNGFGIVFFSPKTMERPEGVVSLGEVLSAEASADPSLKELGLSHEAVKEAEGGASVELPNIEEWKGDVEKVELDDEGFYVVCDSTLVDDLGHWNVWTHDIEREQFAYMNERTAESLGVKDRVKIGEGTLRVKINNNVADGVVFVPNSFEEFQPFDPGVRVGRLLRNAHYRIESLRLK